MTESNMFGGGMIPFDNAYHAALRKGATQAEAQHAGVMAVLRNTSSPTAQEEYEQVRKELNDCKQELEQLKSERMGVIYCINLYGDNILHDALDMAGLLLPLDKKES